MEGEYTAELHSFLTKIARDGMYWQAGTMVVVLYDHLTTFDLEVELIWKRKWSFVKILYLLNRYVGDALFIHGSASQFWVTGAQFEEVCKSALQFQAWLGMIVLWTMNGLIINRILCMWDHDRRILFILLGGFLIHVTAGFVLTGLSSATPSIPVVFTQHFSVCIPVSTPHWFWTFLFFTFGFELLVFVLSFAQGIRYLRETRGNPTTGTFGYQAWAKQTRVVRVLIRDSILFPFIGLVLGLLNILAWFMILPFGSSQVFILVAGASSPILGCRLVLNLRDAYYQRFSLEIQQSAMDKIDQDDIIPRFPTRQSESRGNV
ncbi:hypothetical protein FA15DRAFT_674833, partial [Coprinopsis marcescibilis]